ncbi:MAG: hypothetical protein ACHQ53_13960 [Polyangiales bacterium]
MLVTNGVRLAWLTAIGLLVVCSLAAQAVPIPPHNRADLREAPPRPPSDQRLQELGRTLFAAIAEDAPVQADVIFFPRDAFLLVKAIADPGRYWEQLHARFASDIHALHRQLSDPEHAQYDRLDLATRGGFVRAGEEGNRLPYWASRHSWLYYREHAASRRLEVRVLITWDDRWYVIHLSEFH